MTITTLYGDILKDKLNIITQVTETWKKINILQATYFDYKHEDNQYTMHGHPS